MSFKFRLLGKDINTTLIVFTFVLQFCFFVPLQVLIQNFGEFSVRFVDVLLIYSAISIGLLIVIGLVLRVLKVPALLAALTFLSTVAFLEARFGLVLAQHQPFDGKPINWEVLQWLCWVELGAILVLAYVFALVRKQTQLLSTVSVFILVFIVAGFCYELFTRPGVMPPTRQLSQVDSLYLDQFYRLSDERNIIHIVPDQAQGAMLQDILTSDYDRYSAVFDGFTLFTQATGRYESTYPSVLYYMSGESPEPEPDLVLNQPFTWEYIDRTLQESSIVSVLSQNGFSTFGFQFHPGIFCKGPYTACTGTHDEVFAGVALKSPERRVVLAALTAVDLALFQMTPIVLRKQVYDDGRWFARKLAKGAVTHSGILDLFIEKMEADKNPGTYNYIHHAGAHAPLLFDRNCKYVGPQPVDWQHEREQVTCTLAQLEKMIQSLKEVGVYDQTMIVINGDHGTPWLSPSLPFRAGRVISEALMGMASTLVLIKPPAARGPLAFSAKPVTIGDIPATIAAAFGLDNSYTGVQMFTDEPAADRERHYYSYESASKTHSLQALPDMRRYRIRGDVFDERDWVLPMITSIGEYPSQLRMDHAGFNRYATGFSRLEQHEVPVRWVDGKQVRVLLSPPAKGPPALVFESFDPSFIDGQWMEISAGGRVIAKLDESELKGQRHVIPLPDEMSGKEVIELQFTMGKAAGTGNDKRQLSVLFRYIGLIPAP